MGTIGNNGNLNLVLRDNAASLPVTFHDEGLFVEFAEPETQVDAIYKISLSPLDQEHLTLDLRGILSAGCLDRPGVDFSGLSVFYHAGGGISYNVNVCLRDNEDNSETASRKFYVLPGGIAGKSSPDAANLFFKKWITQLPQIRKTYRWGQEHLFLWAASTISGQSNVSRVEYRIEITKSVGSQVKTGSLSVDSGSELVGLNVGFNVVSSGVSGVIKSYDVSAKIYGSSNTEIASMLPVRYLVEDSKSNYRGFVYRNALGVFDTVYSRGKVAITPEYDPKTFSGDWQIKELDSGAVEKMEINSGAFAGPSERMQWLDFLRSDEKYIVEQDGSVSRIVLDKTSPELKISTVNEITFTIYKSDKPKGNGYGVPTYRLLHNSELEQV